MVQKQAKPPTTRRSFQNAWSELDYLCKKIHFWLYTRKQRARGERYLSRLAQVLRGLPESDDAIIQEEGLALFNELKGELRAAITHRQREIELMERLHKDAQSQRYAASTRAYMLRDRGLAELDERRTILNALKQKQVANGKLVSPKKYRGVADTLASPIT